MPWVGTGLKVEILGEGRIDKINRLHCHRKVYCELCLTPYSWYNIVSKHGKDWHLLAAVIQAILNSNF